MLATDRSQQEGGLLPESMVARLRSWRNRTFDENEWEVLRSCLHSDPRTEVLILRFLEFDDDFLLHGYSDFIRLLIEEGKVSPSLRFWLRDVCSHSSGEDGFSNLPGLEFMQACGEDAERWRRWFFLRICQRHDELKAARDIFVLGGLRYDVDNWLQLAALDEPTLVPLLMDDHRLRYGSDKDLLVVLACQTAVDWDDFDLGDLAEPLADARKRVEGIDGTWERAKRLVYEYPTQSLRGRISGGPLTAGDIAFLRSVLEQQDRHPFHNVAKGRLAEGINDSDDLASLLVSRIGTDDDDWLSWTRLIARYTGDPELRRRLMEDLLRRGDSAGAFSAIRFWSTNSRMPSAEQGIAWIQQVLALPEREGSDIRWFLRRIMVREYGGPDHDFRELLDEFFDGKESPRGEILRHLLQNDSCRREMAARVELAIDEALSDPEAKFAFDLGMPVKTASPRARELWMQVVEMSPDVERRQRAVELLASYHGEHPDTRALLRKFASLNTIRAPVGPERNLAMEAFDWLEILDPVESATVRSLHRYSDVNSHGFVQVPEAFDTEGFREWCEGADQRRQRWMQGVLEQVDFAAESCAFSLVYWFGEHPETLPFLEELVRSSTEPPGHHGTPLADWKKEEHWWKEPRRRAYCLRVIGLYWPDSPEVYQLCREMLEHPWLQVRREAVDFLTREHGGEPEVLELLERLMGRDANIFADYLTLQMGNPSAVAKALAVLGSLDGTQKEGDLAHDGPILLARIFGPRKDLRKGFEDLSLRSPDEGLRQSIAWVLEHFWR